MGMEQFFMEVVLPKKGLEASNDPGLILEWSELNDRHLWLDGPVSWDSIGYILRMIQFFNRSEFKVINPKPIHLHIFSYGGELPAMFALYNAIEFSRIPIYTYNEGAAHSAAFIIYLAGKKRFAYPYSVSVAHEGSSQTEGSFRETKAALKAYEEDVNIMKRIISERTNLSLQEIEEHFERSQDWYIRYEEMIEKEIVNSYFGEDDDVSNWDVNQIKMEMK